MNRAKMAKRARHAYDAAANEYAEHFEHELEGKPLDRELLTRFAQQMKGNGVVWELGSGPGQVGAFVRKHDTNVHGTDLSFEALRLTRALYGSVPRAQTDMLALCAADASLAGVLAFYAICHLSEDELAPAFCEMHRVLKPGGLALISFHIGTEPKHVDDFLGHAADLDFNFFLVPPVLDALTRAGFAQIESIEREPYPGVEHASRRAYVFATKVL